MERMSGVFHYANPTTIYWGPGSLEHLSEELDSLGVKRPYLVSTRSVVANAGLLQRIRDAAGRELAGISGAIGQHAPEIDVEDAIRTAKAADPDGIVSAGGGSPIDAAKIVALRLGEKSNGEGRLPHAAIPTTLSTAELAPTAGMTDSRGQKGGLRDSRLTPSVVFYDAELALHTPLDLWLSTGIRSLDHAVETILESGDHPYPDTLALESIRRLFISLPAAKAEPASAAIRGDNQVAAWFSYSLPRAAGGLSHVLGKQIGSPFGIPHGVTSCLLLPHVMRYRARSQASRMALMAPAMGVARPGADAEELASAAADAVYELVGRLGLPQHLSAYNLTPEQIRAAAEPISGSRYPLDDLLAIYRAAA